MSKTDETFGGFETFEEFMTDWNREIAFTPIQVTCAKCCRKENVGMSGKIIIGYICEHCEPTDSSS